MRYSTSLGLVAASLVSAALAGGENIRIEKLAIHKHKVNHADNEGIIDTVGFKLSGLDADGLSCAVRNPDFPEPIRRTTCGNSNYQFQLTRGTDSDYGIRIYYGEAYVLQPPHPPHPPHPLVMIPIRQHADANFSFRSGFSDVRTSCIRGRRPQEEMCLQEEPFVLISI
ncbi:hypothetical protein EsDP_00001707 [Epichloe bromicola]|uniref:AA1-like domain-containing protein n=1 Tax=Epichloe bromicola TaxID=79588 RepID=A0ABQ0CIP0_9HYPO